MPEDFMRCVKNGGKVVTKKLKDDKYIKICYDKDGNSYSGEVKKAVKNNSEKAYANQKQIDASKVTAKKLMELRDMLHDRYHIE